MAATTHLRRSINITINNNIINNNSSSVVITSSSIRNTTTQLFRQTPSASDASLRSAPNTLANGAPPPSTPTPRGRSMAGREEPIVYLFHRYRCND